MVLLVETEHQVSVENLEFHSEHVRFIRLLRNVREDVEQIVSCPKSLRKEMWSGYKWIQDHTCGH